MRVVVPFGAQNPKGRLAPFLAADERRAFAAAMCRDVLDALAAHEPELLVDVPADELPFDPDCPVTRDDRPLGEAVDAVLAAGGPVAVVMADLPLATPDAVDSLFDSDADVVLAPGRGGGTNAMVVRHPAFRTDYHGASIRDHRERAREVGASVAEVDSFRLATDVDEPADLAEVLLHADGRAADWLVETGVELDVRDGRVGATR
ncbi:2-phospho-L-lactate guanylyltransferase [Halorarius halobius]|uniref:2-phospho-L-lactate guanylyltransferase n=1 Tax=Halorarius halobius TaxID=2962671 RepID=UPI0020CFB170|nr:2-phospho-L-lactate guanylyltransferase [Halorarius halobius]